MKFVSYWETATGRSIPAYVALALVSIQRALGDSFLLLTPETAPEYIGTSYLNKQWGFTKLDFDLAPSIVTIVAKSDFIRMAYVYHQGGIWLDADTIAFKDPTPSIFSGAKNNKLYWYSEAFFGAHPRNAILEQSLTNALEENPHHWGNPGDIKGLIARHPDLVIPVSNHWFDPGCRPLYNFASCEMMRSTKVSIEQFLTNPDLTLLKLYNTYFSRTTDRPPSVKEFLQSNTLLAKLFLHLEPDLQYWIYETDMLIKRCKLL